MFSAISSDRLLIRDLEVRDAQKIFQYRSDPENSRFQGWVPDSAQSVETYINKIKSIQFLEPGTWYQLSLESLEHQFIIGDCAICAGQEHPGQVEIGVSLDPKFHKNGFAHEGLKAIINYLFKETDTHRVHCSIDPRNIASINLVNKLGFRKEGHMRESLWFKGEWADDVVFGMLKQDWEEFLGTK